MLHPERWSGDTYTEPGLVAHLSVGGPEQVAAATQARVEVLAWARLEGLSRVGVVRWDRVPTSGVTPGALKALEQQARARGAEALLLPLTRDVFAAALWLGREGYERVVLDDRGVWVGRRWYGAPQATERLYASRADVPPQLGSLTVPQANYWSRVYDAVLARDGDAEKAARIAWYQTRRRLAKHGRVPRRASGAVERMPTDVSEWDSWLGEGSRYAAPLAEQIPESPAAEGVTEAALDLYDRHLRRSPTLPKPLGKGGSRVVYPLGNLVLKVERNPRDPNAEPDMNVDGSALIPSYANAVSYSNSDEIRVWVEAPPEIRKHLVPLVAWAPDGAWVVMDRVTPGGTPSSEVLQMLGDCGIEDLYDGNIAEDGRILDYGMLDLKAWATCRGDDFVERLPTAAHSAASIATAWARERRKINDDQMPIMLPIEDLVRVREYAWTREHARNSPEEWDALVASMRAHGWNPKKPAHLIVGKDGRAKLGEGNHRLAIARSLGIREVPVEVHFYQTVDGGHRVVGPDEVERLSAGGVPIPDGVVQFSARWSPVGTLARTARGEDLTDDLPGIERIRDVRDRAYAEARAALRRVGRRAGPDAVERLPTSPTASQREMLQALGFWSEPGEIDLDHARRHMAESPRDHAALIVAHRILTGRWECHGPDVDALVRYGVHPWYTVVEVLRVVDPEGEIEDPPKPEGMPEDRDAFAVERMAAAEPAWLDLDTVLAAVPAAAANDVSEVARSRRGFVAAYRDADGDPDALGRDAHSGQDWRARRNAFVARHRAQAEGEGYWSDGAPTRRHLALAMWAWSPDPKRLRAWIERA